MTRAVRTLVREAKAARVTVATAESVTGGLVAGAVTGVPGASDVFLGGVIAYSDAAKRRLLGVPSRVLAAHGAVSAPVARAMAEGARRRFRADVAVATTGYAGPAGDAGLVFVAVAARGRRTVARRHSFEGSRSAIRRRATAAAIAGLLSAVASVRSAPGRAIRRSLPLSGTGRFRRSIDRR